VARKSVADAGVIDLEMYRVGNRMFMILEVDESFYIGKEKMRWIQLINTIAVEWENFDVEISTNLAGGKTGEKWMVMKNFYQLNES
jgi:L-rhamnose mutarotase